jgi:hypothetical protein
VVPDEISECQPDTAPQAIVMNRKGKILPAQTGPEPSTNLVKAGICRSGRTMMIAIANSVITPIFIKVDR